MDKRKILVCYHRADYDGVFSAIICKEYYESKGVRVDVFGWNYGDELFDVNDKIEKYQGIVMVDICIPPLHMKQLADSGKLTWIDHHETAIKDSENFGFNEVPGIRTIGTAAVELVWKYFYPNKPAPIIIQYIGAYDVWDKERFNWEEDVVPLQYGLKDTYGLSLKKLEGDWENLCEDCEWIMDNGFIIFNWIKHSSESWVQNCGFEVSVGEQGLKGIAIITPITGSLVFESVIQKYDLFLVVQVRDNAGRISVSMYTEPDKDLGGFSCGEYMKEKYGGGGHACSAGCNSIDEETFRRLVYEHKF